MRTTPWLVDILATAQEWRITPSAFLNLSAEEQMLMLGYRAYKRNFHHSCGEPIDVAFNSEMDGGGYERQIGTCYACATLNKHTNENGEEIDLKPGQFVYLRQAWDPIEKKEIPGLGMH